MKIPILFTLLVLVWSGPLWAVENPNLRSPVGSPTAVPSATRSGLIPNRPYDALGRNDIVTGTVGGMTHFRGVVPYSSGYYYGSAASSPVDNFLRRSHDPIASDRSPGQYRSYYDPRRTVASSVRSDGTGLYSPLITSQGQADPYTPPMLAQTVGTQYRPRQLSLSDAELERVLARQMHLRDDIDRPRPAQDILDATAISEHRADSIFFRDYLLGEELTPRDEVSPETGLVEEQKPILKPEQLIRDEFLEELEEQLRQEESERIVELLRERPAAQDIAAAAPAAAGRPRTDTQADSTEGALSDDQQAQAAELLRQYKTFEQLAAAKLADYLAVGERLLKEGKFYQAVDAFALGAVWAPDDARPYAGQSFALFAAGEYMSSAFYLSQAILRNSAVSSEKADLALLIGDRDVFENRLVEMTTWQQRSDSGELAFLMAFVLHQDSKPQRAAEAIRIAVDKMPDNKAVRILRNVIVPHEATGD